MSSENKKNKVYPVLPLRDQILFPYMMSPFFVGRSKSLRSVEKAVNEQVEIVLISQKKAKTINPAPEDLYQVGTLSSIIQVLRLPDGTLKVLIEGEKASESEGICGLQRSFSRRG